MPQCPDCGCDLPSLQTLCSKCFDARYALAGRPQSFLESIHQFGSNPRRQQVIQDRIKAESWWVPWCFAAVGLALDWRLAFEWLAGRSFFLSPAVLGKTGLIVLPCAGVALLAVCLTRQARLRDGLVLFSAISMIVYRFLSTHWDINRLIARH